MMRYDKMTPGKMRQELEKKDKEISVLKKDKRKAPLNKRTDITDGDFSKKT